MSIIEHITKYLIFPWNEMELFPLPMAIPGLLLIVSLFMFFYLRMKNKLIRSTILFELFLWPFQASIIFFICFYWYVAVPVMALVIALQRKDWYENRIIYYLIEKKEGIDLKDISSEYYIGYDEYWDIAYDAEKMEFDPLKMKAYDYPFYPAIIGIISGSLITFISELFCEGYRLFP